MEVNGVISKSFPLSHQFVKVVCFCPCCTFLHWNLILPGDTITTRYSFYANDVSVLVTSNTEGKEVSKK